MPSASAPLHDNALPPTSPPATERRREFFGRGFGTLLTRLSAVRLSFFFLFFPPVSHVHVNDHTSNPDRGATVSQLCPVLQPLCGTSSAGEWAAVEEQRHIIFETRRQVALKGHPDGSGLYTTARINNFLG